MDVLIANNSVVGFEPWNNSFVSCTGHDDCVELAVNGEPGSLATCVDFQESNSFPDGWPTGQFCVCNMAYSRFGNDCELQSSDNKIGLFLLPVGLITTTMLLWMLWNAFKLWNAKVLQNNVTSWTIFLCLVGGTVGAIWGVERIFLGLGASQVFYTINVICAAILAGFTAILLTMTTLLWNEVVKKSKKMQKGSGSGMQKHGKVIVFIVSFSIFLAVLLLAINGHTDQVAKLCMGYLCILGLFYIFVARKLKKLISQSVATGSDAKTNKAIFRIQKNIRGVLVFMLCFFAGGLLYSALDNQTKAKSLQFSYVSHLALGAMQTAGAYCCFLTFNYASDPLLKKINRSSVHGTAMAESSAVSTAVGVPAP